MLGVAVVVAPDESVKGNPAGDRPKSRDERHEHQQQSEHHHQTPDQRIGVVRLGERRHLVPEGVEPHPRLARGVADLVHHAPLVTGKILGAGLILEVGPVGEQQQ